MKLKVGPVLGFEPNSTYTVCFSSEKHVQQAQLLLNNGNVACVKIGETPSSYIWRSEYQVVFNHRSQHFIYQIFLDGIQARCQNNRDQWTFVCPSINETPNLVYTSCNGFSSLDLMHKTQAPYRLWERMANQHEQKPVSLILMGGDQLYADDIWSAIPELKKWNDLNHREKISRKASKILRDQIDRFYDRIYQERWSNESMSLMLASAPSLMMWDDHDIFDGWGSFPAALQNCDVFQQIFKTAKRYFELFQIRSKLNNALLNPQEDHYAFALKFHNYNILGLDNRTERTLEQVMGSETQWPLINDYLDQLNDEGHLLVMSAVPIIYRDFSFTESVFDITPWEEELTDDLKDHWRSKEHQGERARLIHHLLDNSHKRRQANPESKTVILSGDVHIGCIGVINDTARNCKVHQVVSSGIMHPAPSRLQWIGIMAVTNDKIEYLNEDRTIHISMLTPFSSDKYIRQRNYVTLSMGSDKKLWVNWESEGKDKPCYPIQ